MKGVSSSEERYRRCPQRVKIVVPAVLAISHLREIYFLGGPLICGSSRVVFLVATGPESHL